MAAPNFLGLARELRDKILRYCMFIGIIPFEKSPCVGNLMLDRYNHSTTPQCSLGYNSQASSQILRCCKMIYDEALPILYGENVLYFNFPGEKLVKTFSWNPKIVAEIKHTYIGAGPHKAKTFKMLAVMPKLKSFGYSFTEHLPLRYPEDQVLKRIKKKFQYSSFVFHVLSMVPRDIEVGLLICDAQYSKVSPLEIQVLILILTIFPEWWTVQGHTRRFEWSWCVEVYYQCNWHKRVFRNFEARRSPGGIERKPQGRRWEGLSSASIQGLISQCIVLTKIAESLDGPEILPENFGRCECATWSLYDVTTNYPAWDISRRRE